MKRLDISEQTAMLLEKDMDGCGRMGILWCEKNTHRKRHDSKQNTEFRIKYPKR